MLLYVHLLEGDAYAPAYYYVSTSEVHNAWTDRHHVVRELSRVLIGPSLAPAHVGIVEDAEVLRLMHLHGIETVRDGSFSAVNIDRHVNTIQTIMWHADGKCPRCGSSDHSECDEDSEEDSEEDDVYDNFCGRCGAQTHTKSKCRATRDVKKRWL